MKIDRVWLDSASDLNTIQKMNISFSKLSIEDIMLIGFQRTKQVSKLSTKAWENGDDTLLRNEAVSRRTEIFEGALLEIYREYLPLYNFLKEHKIKPKSVLDIGCGQGINNLFLNRDFKPKFTLLDIEETPEQYHGWNNKGSGYASLDAASSLLQENGIKKTSVKTINPRKENVNYDTLKPDLVTSFYSCGFHYPIDEYSDFFIGIINDGGSICLDIRKHYLKRRPPPISALLEAGTMHEIYEDERSMRVLVRK